MRVTILSILLMAPVSLLGACSSETSESVTQEDLAAAPSIVGTFVHAPTSVAPPPGAVRSALLELEFTTKKDAQGRLVFMEKERSDDVHAPALSRSGFYTSSATEFTLHFSDELAYGYKYELDGTDLIFWSADSGERREFLVRR
jgi:hypothetical protein